MKWKELIEFAEQVFDNVVREDYAELIICPDCGEPIYEEDYMENNLCPCCEFDFSEV